MREERPAIDPIAARSMAPLIERVCDVLDGLDADAAATERIAEALGQAYVAGLTDGARDAVGQVAAEAERRGLSLKLAPELQAAEPPDPPEPPAAYTQGDR